jgi:hypothetical protein
VPRRRQQLEKALAAAAHALPAAWRRLQLLSQVVCDQGASLSEEQLSKERELLVDLRDRLAAAAQVCVCVCVCGHGLLLVWCACVWTRLLTGA